MFECLTLSKQPRKKAPAMALRGGSECAAGTGVAAPLQLAAQDHLATAINAVDLKYRLGNIPIR
jgi:hypothetical protein